MRSKKDVHAVRIAQAKARRSKRLKLKGEICVHVYIASINNVVPILLSKLLRGRMSGFGGLRAVYFVDGIVDRMMDEK